MSEDRAVENFVKRSFLLIGFVLGVWAGRWVAVALVGLAFLILTAMDLWRVNR